MGLSIHARAVLPSRHGGFQIVAFVDGEGQPVDDVAVCMIPGGALAPDAPAPLVRVHSECLTGDAFGSLRCDCGEQLETALDAIAAEGHGAVVYLRQEGRGIGIAEKVRAYTLQESGMDTLDANLELGHAADARSYERAVHILKCLGMTQVRLMTNNPQKVEALRAGGIGVERRALEAPAGEHNRAYLETKRDRMGHLLSED